MKRKTSPVPSEPSHSSSRGPFQGPQTDKGRGSSSIEKRVRVLTVDLARLDNTQWRSLRDAAAAAARYANRIVAGRMANLLGCPPPEGRSWGELVRASKNQGPSLTSYVIDAVVPVVDAQWKKHAKLIARGARRPPWFDEHGALCVRGDDDHPGVRLESDDKGFWLVAKVWRDEEPFRLRLQPNVKADSWLRPRLEQMVGMPIPRATFSVLPKKGRVLVRLSYEEHVAVAPPGERTATLAMNPDGRLLLRCEEGERFRIEDYTYRVHQLRHMKEHFAGILARLRRRGFGRGKGDAARRRKLLVKAGSFDGWAGSYAGPLHQMSADMLKRCQEWGVGKLSILTIRTGDWPAERLEEMLRYKAETIGIVVTMPDIADEPTARSFDAETKRKLRKAAEGRRAAKKLADAHNETI